MGLFDLLFKSEPKKKVNGYFQVLNGYSPVYSNYNGGVYEMLQTKAIINTIATDCGKAIPEVTMHNKRFEYMLQHRPNPFMHTSEFIERVVTNYLCDNNSYIIPMLDEYDRTIGLFPVTFDSVEAIDVGGELYLRYRFPNGSVGTIEYSRVGVMRRMQYKNDLFGDNNRALQQTLNVMHAQNESIEEALKQSGSIRFMAQLNETVIDKSHLKRERDEFNETNLNNANGQMMIYDSRYKEIKQIESHPVYLDEKQQNLIDENARDYFGVSKNVIQHNFGSDYEWNSYYEGVIEPILIKLSEALTSMLYTEAQVMNGNCVYVTTNRLQYMSNESKLNFSSSMFDRGIIDGNTVCDVWNLPHFEGGEKHYIRKEYAELNKLDEPIEQEEVEGEEDEK